MDLFFILLSGLGIGFAGNLHCIGMCGPLAISLSSTISVNKNSAIASLIYQLSRISSYLFIGLVMGIIGHGISLVVLQQWISITTGVFLLLYMMFFHSKIDVWIDNLRLFGGLKRKISTLINQPLSYSGIAKLGLLNGFLPCGLVYMTGVVAISSGNILHAIILMLGFGLATLPVMFTMMYFGAKMNFRYRSLIRKASPIVMYLVAILLLIRGLNLGIPYVSPKLESDKMSCCERKR